MATYFAAIPPDISAKEVFESVGAEVISSMDGVCVVAHGDQSMGEHFSTTSDEVFKACTDSKEILKKICDGASIGRLCVSGGGWKVQLWRDFRRMAVDDPKVPRRDHYSVTVTLIAPDWFSEDDAVKREYTRWLVPLEAPDQANVFCRIYGVTKDISMGYRIRDSLLPAFVARLGLGERGEVESYGEVQEKGQLMNFSVDLARYGFRGLYSVYPEWSNHSVTNYPSEAYTRFCSLVDTHDSRVVASVGRRHCAFRCKDGHGTRTLEGNRFDIYRTKTRRSLTVSFDQYADEDPPVRAFSAGVRARLASLRVKI